MRGFAAQNAAEGDDGVVFCEHGTRDLRNFERAGNAIDNDRLVRYPVSRQTLQGAGQQPLDDFVIETAGDHAEAQTSSIVFAFERAGHDARL